MGVERMKSENQALKERHAKDKADMEAQNSVLMGYNQEMKDFEKNPQNTLTPSSQGGGGGKDVGPEAQKQIKALEDQLKQANDEKKRLQEENQRLKAQSKNLSTSLSEAKKSASIADSKYRSATEEHLKERSALRDSLSKAGASGSGTKGSVKVSTSKGTIKSEIESDSD